MCPFGHRAMYLVKTISIGTEWRSILGVTSLFILFFFNDTATTEIYTLSLHDALPVCRRPPAWHTAVHSSSSASAAPSLAANAANNARTGASGAYQISWVARYPPQASASSSDTPAATSRRCRRGIRRISLATPLPSDRSASTAVRHVIRFVTRWYVGAGWPTSAAPQARQNRAPGRFSAPHVGHDGPDGGGSVVLMCPQER